ncbi:unnamed protein product [Rotaria sp. Silwood2]|nr:unnamed protein product [Rotaria sp. Silwood2]
MQNIDSVHHNSPCTLSNRAEIVGETFVVYCIWPIISKYVENIVKNIIEPEIKKQISGLSFEQINLGDFRPRLDGIKIYKNSIHSNEIILDIELFYGGDIQIKMKYYSLKIGIKSFYLHGQLRLVIKSNISKIPFISALELFFLRIPIIHFDLTDIANLIEIPGLYNLLILSFERLLQTFIVVPNRLIIAFFNDIDINQLKFPKPDAMLRIDIIEGKNLSKYNHSLFRKKYSINTFVIINVGQYKLKTHTQKTNNPKWYETFEIPIEQPNIQQLQISVFNTALGIDYYIGTLNISLYSIRSNNKNFVDQWDACSL